MLKSSASEFFHGGLFTLSAYLVNPNFYVCLRHQHSTTVSLGTHPFIDQKIKTSHNRPKIFNPIFCVNHLEIFTRLNPGAGFMKPSFDTDSLQCRQLICAPSLSNKNLFG